MDVIQVQCDVQILELKNLHNQKTLAFMTKVAATSFKLEIRLHAHEVGTTHDLVPKSFLRSSDWLMRSEQGYFAPRLNSGLNDGATTLNDDDKNDNKQSLGLELMIRQNNFERNLTWRALLALCPSPIADVGETPYTAAPGRVA